MDNPINYFRTNFTKLFVNQNTHGKKGNNALKIFRIHSAKLKNIGDLSFPINADMWEKYYEKSRINLKLCRKLTDAETQDETLEEILETSSNWKPYPVEGLRIKEKRCEVFLNRCICMEALLKQVLMAEIGQMPFGVLKKCSDRRIHLRGIEIGRDITNLPHYRTSLVYNVLRRILAYSDYTEVEDNEALDEAVLQLRVISVFEEQDIEDDHSVLIKCGSVLDPSTGKLTTLSTEEYIKLRISDMRLMAVHKYGVRGETAECFIPLMKRLGEAAVTVDLLEVKHSTPMQLIRNGQGSTRGASFILYNSARLETLLRKFQDLVANSTYAELPSIDAVNLKLLCEEEEWQLSFCYILQFPSLIERCLENIEKGLCATHLIVRYLSAFTALFSIYYRRVRILTQETPLHMMPYVYARIYLIKAVRVVLNQILALLNIKPMAFM